MVELLSVLLSEIKGHKLYSTISIVGGTVCPGLLALYYFQREAFANLDIFKILLLTLAITIPMLLINYTLAFLCLISRNFKSDVAVDYSLTFGSAANAIVFYLNLFFLYISDSKDTMGSYIATYSRK